jgi:hypothetical protein
MRIIKTSQASIENQDQETLSRNDIQEGVRFFDPERNQKGKLVTRKYHQTTLWMKLYDNGEIEELFNGDLKRIQKIGN